MSRHRSKSSAMGPPPDRDIVMGPPPVPTPAASSSAQPKAGHDAPEIVEKYKKLKRRFFELEEKHKETTSEVHRSSERSVRMHEEREYVRSKILELEGQVDPNGSSGISSISNVGASGSGQSASVPLAQASSSAFPRTLLNAKARTSFIANLRQAIAEDDADDDIDPILTSRHVGPQARKREEEEQRRLQGEEVHETQTKKGGRKTRASVGNTQKGKEAGSSQSVIENQMSPRVSTSPEPTFEEGSSPPDDSPSHSPNHPPPAPQEHYFHETPHELGHIQPTQSSLTADRGLTSAGGGMEEQRHELSVPASVVPEPIYPKKRGPKPKKINPDAAAHEHTFSVAPPLAPSTRARSTRKTRSTRSDAAAIAAAAAEAAKAEAEAEAAAAVAEAETAAMVVDGETAAAGSQVQMERDGISASVGDIEIEAGASVAGTGKPSAMNDVSGSDVPSGSGSEVKKIETPSRVVAVGLPEEEGGPAEVGGTSFSPSVPPSTESLPMMGDVVTMHDPQATPAANPDPPPSSESHHNDQSPIMQNIVKVAEAAVAAQKAASASPAVSSSNTPAPQNNNIDPNLDPSLIAESVTQLQSQNGAASNARPPTTQVNESASASGASNGTNDAASHGTASRSPSVSSPNLSGNPYLSLSTMMPMKQSGSPTPTSAVHPMSMNPYSMYYPTPGTPITPTTPGFNYANPYYYLAGPMAAGPSGMYPASPSFVPPSTQRPPTEVQRHAKPKRLKAHTVTSKNFSIPMVPRDKKGKPMLPLNVGIMTVINLGEVCMREHFHTERYIFPVGYEVTRRYLSTVDPNAEVVYHCTILDGGDGPKFQIVPSDVPDRPVIAGTATGAWSSIVKQSNIIRNRQHSNSVSGPDFFGLGQNTIKHLIQELPNADRLRDYVWQHFVEGGPLGGRHAAVIPALPEEYNASMPIGAYYPAAGDKLKREANASPNSPRGSSHYPQHILAQAEAQRAQQQAVEQAKEQGQQPASPSQLQDGAAQPAPKSSAAATRHLGRVTRSTSAAHESSGPGPIRNTRRTSRSPSVQSSRGHSAQAANHPSPYLANATANAAAANASAAAAVAVAAAAASASPAGSSTSPPPLPATFASIMNAYPAPASSASPNPQV